MKTMQIKYYTDGKYSHEYTEKWEKTDLFCPACGKRDVHEEQGSGDYHLGTWFLCAACGAGFHLPTYPEHRPGDEQDMQRLAAIRAECPRNDETARTGLDADGTGSRSQRPNACP